MGAGGIISAIKRLRVYLWGKNFSHIFGLQGSREHRQSGGPQRERPAGLELLIAFDYILEYRKGSTNANTDFLSRLPEPATGHDRGGSSRLTPVDVGGVFLIRVSELRTRSSPTPGVGLGGLVPRPGSVVLCRLPFTSSTFHDFRAHWPRRSLTTFLLLLGDSTLV